MRPRLIAQLTGGARCAPADQISPSTVLLSGPVLVAAVVPEVGAERHLLRGPDESRPRRLRHPAEAHQATGHLLHVSPPPPWLSKSVTAVEAHLPAHCGTEAPHLTPLRRCLQSHGCRLGQVHPGDRAEPQVQEAQQQAEEAARRRPVRPSLWTTLMIRANVANVISAMGSSQHASVQLVLPVPGAASHIPPILAHFQKLRCTDCCAGRSMTFAHDFPWRARDAARARHPSSLPCC